MFAAAVPIQGVDEQLTTHHRGVMASCGGLVVVMVLRCAVAMLMLVGMLALSLGLFGLSSSYLVADGCYTAIQYCTAIQKRMVLQRVRQQERSPLRQSLA